MADGTISIADGLGLKALDSNEVRRKQQISDLSKSSQVRSTQMEMEIQKVNISGNFNSVPILGNVNQATTSTGFGSFSPKTAKNLSPSRKLQQVFEETLVREAEERAAHLSNNINSTRYSQTLINARGTPYLEGDPNMGYDEADTKPRRPSHLASQVNHFTTEIHPTLPQTHKPNPNPNAVRIQGKPKPRNWASLLQSQSPSLEMKLDYFPDLQRGKEALVEIDLELTEVGKWNRYFVGHFLDGKMAYPLLLSTARNQWKDLFVAVKSDVARFYMFEFRDEQTKIQVLEGGPYVFSQKYLVLKDWHRMMKPAKEQPFKIPAWVKFHDLPFELWNQDCLSRVASAVGRPLHVDQATAKTARQPGLLQTKSTKARICIEVSAQQDLPDEVTVDTPV
ncbi:hypothetical protein RHGRI_011203 [Rhododendron griersonianum]|uniref:DUF4283 domain-containing protein n=1 Tax=Rhododendron griersonianum TaxID=479676 RepID=A0AAV6KL79_9ERIC|nr:hypothetical protein RHGRI_011203 [Rhododendron griersonianum]